MIWIKNNKIKITYPERSRSQVSKIFSSLYSYKLCDI